MLLDEIVFFRRKTAGFPQQIVGQPQFTDIIYERTPDQQRDVFCRQRQPRTEYAGDQGGIQAVRMCHIIISGQHVIQIVQQLLTGGSADDDVMIYLHQIIHVDGFMVHDVIYHVGFIYGKKFLIIGFKFFKALAEADFFKMCCGEVNFFLDGDDQNGMPRELFNDRVSDFGIGRNDDFIFVT